MRFGAPFARVIMAMSVSTIMTSSVVAPMAFQAHSARSLAPASSPHPQTQLLVPPVGPRDQVLPESVDREGALGPELDDGSSTTEPGSPDTTSPPASASPSTSEPISDSSSNILSSGLYYASTPNPVDSPPEPARALAGARLSQPTYLLVSLPDIAAVKFFIDGDPVALASLPPWNLYLGTHIDPAELDEGPHTVTAKVKAASGVITTHRATFTTVHR